MSIQYGKTHLTSTIKWGVTVYKVEYSPQVVDDSTPGDPDAVMAGLLLLPKHVSDTEGAGKFCKIDDSLARSTGRQYSVAEQLTFSRPACQTMALKSSTHVHCLFCKHFCARAFLSHADVRRHLC